MLDELRQEIVPRSMQNMELVDRGNGSSLVTPFLVTLAPQSLNVLVSEGKKAYLGKGARRVELTEVGVVAVEVVALAAIVEAATWGGADAGPMAGVVDGLGDGAPPLVAVLLGYGYILFDVVDTDGLDQQGLRRHTRRVGVEVHVGEKLGLVRRGEREEAEHGVRLV